MDLALARHMHPADACMREAARLGPCRSMHKSIHWMYIIRESAAMTDLVTYSHSGPTASIVMNDGKANVMSTAMSNALHAAFDQAERDNAVPILKARGKHFSGGFDLTVF